MRSLLCVVVVVLVACGGGGGNKPVKPTPPTTGSGSATVADKPTAPAKPVEAPKPVDPMSKDCKDMTCLIDQMEVFAKQICECKDKACTEKVQQSFTDWATKLGQKEELKDLRPNEAESRRVQEVTQKYVDCAMKYMGGMDGSDETPPPTNTGLGGGLKK